MLFTIGILVLPIPSPTEPTPNTPSLEAWAPSLIRLLANIEQLIFALKSLVLMDFKLQETFNFFFSKRKNVVFAPKPQFSLFSSEGKWKINDRQTPCHLLCKLFEEIVQFEVNTQP